MSVQAVPARLLTGIMAVLVVACSSPEQKAEYVTVAAEIGDVRDSVPAMGTLLAEGMAEIRAARSGVISVVHVKEGDRVRAGQVLATLSSPTRAPYHDEATANAAAADATYREAVIALKVAEDQLARSRTLEARGFVSPAAVRNDETRVEQARTAIERLVSERSAARARVRRTSGEGAGSDVIAPLDGTITLATARVGQRVSAEDERPLFQTTQDERKMTLEILIAEADLSRVSEKSQVVFAIDAYPGTQNQATLISIGRAPIRDGRFVSYRALAEYDNFGNVFRPGMTASVQLIKANARSVLRIPWEALLFSPPDYMPPLPPGMLEELIREHRGDMEMVRASAGGHEFGRGLRNGTRIVFVLENDKPVRREVRVGAETDEFIEVTEGLKQGDEVILKNRTDPRDAV